MNGRPDISFVMTGFNSERTVRDAIMSALSQQSVNHEVVYVDDGSTDGTLGVLESLRDGRLVVKPSSHIGRAHALNLAIAVSSGDLVAVLDADDIACPRRAVAQTAFMASNRGCVAVGGQLEPFDDSGQVDRSGRLRFPTDPSVIDRWIKRGRMPLAHPALTYRKSWFTATGGYDPSVPRAEDFDLVLRGWRPGIYSALPNVMTRYRTAMFPTWRYWRRERTYSRAVHRRWAAGDQSPLSLNPKAVDLVSDIGVWSAQLMRHRFVNRKRSVRM